MKLLVFHQGRCMNMLNKKLISVIVPVYNIEKYIRRCVQSICNQTHSELEIILVDDGSTDSSFAICKELEKEDARIIVRHKENGGSSSARNLGISIATGDYIGFVDSDDYIAPDMYQRLWEALAETNHKIAQIGRCEMSEEQKELENSCPPPKEQIIYEAKDFLKELLLHKGDASFCTKLCARELFEESKFPEGILNEDFYLLVQLLQRGEKIVSLPQIGYYVFCRMGSNTRTIEKNQFSRVFLDNVHNADIVEKIVRDFYPDLLEIAIRFGYVQRLDYLLHIPIVDMNQTKDRKSVV